jgi:hypothetical protein
LKSGCSRARLVTFQSRDREGAVFIFHRESVTLIEGRTITMAKGMNQRKETKKPKKKKA